MFSNTAVVLCKIIHFASDWRNPFPDEIFSTQHASWVQLFSRFLSQASPMLLMLKEQWISPGADAHGTFKTFAVYRRSHLFRRSDLRRDSDDERSLPRRNSGLVRCAFGAGVLGWGAGWIGFTNRPINVR